MAKKKPAGKSASRDGAQRFTDEERAAMRERAKELKAARSRPTGASEEARIVGLIRRAVALPGDAR